MMDAADQDQYLVNYMNQVTFSYYTNLSRTPVVSLLGSKTLVYSSSGLTLTFSRQNATLPVAGVQAYQTDANDVRFGDPINLPVLSVSITNGNFTVNANELSSGKWTFLINFTDYGYAKINDILEITASAAPTATAIGSSYAGGNLFVVTGAGLNKRSSLKIDGQEAELVS